MSQPVRTSDPAAVQGEAQRVYLELFPGGDQNFVGSVFSWVVDCFEGRFDDYQAIDAPYHDLEHTLQGTLCLVRLLRGRQFAGASPALAQRDFELALLAVLLHDSGYIKRRGDTSGTGAKYTADHVHRSIELAERLLRAKEIPEDEIRAVQNMISCTISDVDPGQIPFRTAAERVCGMALATSDLLGQMAAEDYVAKLPILHAELAEAARNNQNPPSFPGALELIERTPSFWRNVVRPKLEKDFQGLYRFLNDPYPTGPNEYFRRIEANMRHLEA